MKANTFFDIAMVVWISKETKQIMMKYNNQVLCFCDFLQLSAIAFQRK